MKIQSITPYRFINSAKNNFKRFEFKKDSFEYSNPINFNGQFDSKEEKRLALYSKVKSQFGEVRKKYRYYYFLYEQDIKPYSCIECLELLHTILSEEKLYSNEGFMQYAIHDISLECDSKESSKQKQTFLDKVLSNENLSDNKDFIKEIGQLMHITCINDKKADKFIDLIGSDERLYKNEYFIKSFSKIVISSIRTNQVDNVISFINKILDDKRIDNAPILLNYLGKILDSITNGEEELKAKLSVIDCLLSNDDLCQDTISFINSIDVICSVVEENSAKIAKTLLSNEGFYKNSALMHKANLFVCCSDENIAQYKIDILNTMLSSDTLYDDENYIKDIAKILEYIKNQEQKELAKVILSNKKCCDNPFFIDELPDIILSGEQTAKNRTALINKILSDVRLYNISEFASYARLLIDTDTKRETDSRIAFIDFVLGDERLYKNEDFMDWLPYILCRIKTIQSIDCRKEIIDAILSNENLSQNKNIMEQLGGIVCFADNTEIVEAEKRLLANKKLINNEYFAVFANSIFNGTSLDSEKVNLIEKCLDENIGLRQIVIILEHKYYEKYSFEDISKINHELSDEELNQIKPHDFETALKFIGVAHAKRINEIGRNEKRKFLKNLVDSSDELFCLSDDMKKLFPLLPKDQKEYCTLLPSLVRSLGIETKELNEDEIEQFNKDLFALSDTLKNISDEDFENLKITQSYSKDEFIFDVLDKTSALSEKERLKVFDYFGFELQENKNDKSGFILLGYPVNLNNGKKLAQITNPNTKEVVENLRSDVIRFSQNNKIKTGNIKLDEVLNNILNVLPELRIMIDKSGFDENDDLFKHSLRTIKRLKTPEFDSYFNDSDKKILLLACLFQSIAKKDKEYNDDTSDMFLAIKKARMTYVEEIYEQDSAFDTFFIAKKFNLSDDEELKLYKLIKYQNLLSNESALLKNNSVVAYNFKDGNIIRLALPFSIAKSNHERYSEEMHTAINDVLKRVRLLQETQPFLPVTKFPSASRINQAIKKVYKNGSTDIKGVYKDKQGVIILKYNELQNKDLAKIGFPKGSTVLGTVCDLGGGEMVDTGNIKFFVHGFKGANKLGRFSGYSMIDSDFLLSVSYAERPESKYKFFESQGVILDCDTNNIHGGGQTDSGSGYKKTLEQLKFRFAIDNETFNRSFVSDLIKRRLHFNGYRYKELVEQYVDKPLSEIEPKELRDEITLALASMNSKTRFGGRNYNEMYITNPKPPMAVYAYPREDDEIKRNPIDFLHEKKIRERTKYVYEYAKENDIPFIIFGD